MRGRRAAGLCAVVLCAMGMGCRGPTRRYFRRRAADLGDCFILAGGVGGPVYARVKATDFVVAGAGCAVAVRDGWYGRKSLGPFAGRGGVYVLIPEGGIPLLLNVDRTGPQLARTYGPSYTQRWYGGFEPEPRVRLADRFWMGATATLLLSVEVGFNPVEFADFLAGWFGWDMLGDAATKGEALRAVHGGDAGRLRRLLDTQPELVATEDASGKTLLHLAADKNRLELARLLLDKGADVKATDSLGRTACHGAVLRGHAEMATLLVDRGADVNTKDKEGWTPLHHAACFGHAELTRLLLRRGAAVNAKDRDGRTPLHAAALGRRTGTARILLDGGADANARDHDGRTPLAYATERRDEELAELLRARGAK